MTERQRDRDRETKVSLSVSVAVSVSPSLLLLRALSFEDPLLHADMTSSNRLHVILHAYKFRFEDPLLWRDTRGSFHIILHAYLFRYEESCAESSVSAHLFSDDGKE